MASVDVEPDVALHVQDVGAGRPVVLLAGFGLNHAVWDGTVLALGATNRVLCIDLRGTGRSDKPIGDYGMERLAADVVAVLDALDLEDVTLVGYSFGGQIALKVAATAPKRLAQLVLVCSNGVRASRSDEFPFGPEPAPLQAALVNAERERRVATRRRTVVSAFASEPDAGLLDWLVRQQLDMPSWAAVACYDTYLNTDLVGLLPRVTLPVLQIIGTEDPVTVAEGAPWLQERLADARLVAIEGCGHYPMFEARAEFDEALMGFVAEAG
ncbi:Non-heme chloroperoxidase [Paraconexibacter sp. AEG42_29]|uniref:Non-heme chloroperoxidase n=1 Tax=Paraconexibacter sp. AEG42_29 TaxID=2997339 RepID=A0AAU7B3I7_9ACTN